MKHLEEEWAEVVEVFQLENYSDADKHNVKFGLICGATAVLRIMEKRVSEKCVSREVSKVLEEILEDTHEIIHEMEQAGLFIEMQEIPTTLNS